VRLTPSESDIPPPQSAPTPPDDPAGPQAVEALAEGHAGDGRRALREARRQRRRTAWVCAAVVGLCLALTIVVVSLARERPVSPSGIGAAAVTVSASVPTTAPVSGTLLAAVTSHSAPAPEGGNP